MRVLVSAYACEPDKGSEPEVGLRTVLAAATRHEVWVLTRQNNVDALRQFLVGHSASERIHVEGLDLGMPATLVKRRFRRMGMQWYYNQWQRLAGEKADELDRLLDFHVIHHVTLSSYWSTVGVASVAKPFVWGPVGGGVEAPLGLYTELGWKGALAEGARVVLRPAFARLNGARRLARRAMVVLAANPETARRLGGPAGTAIVPNATSVVLEVPQTDAHRTQEVAFVGRLIPLKGAVIAVRAMRYVRAPINLTIFGRGPELARVWRRANRLGVRHRVEVVGELPRDELLRRIHRSALVIHAAVHEEGSLAVAESLTLGTPLVAIDRGGPALLARLWEGTPSRLVRPSTPRRTARELAQAIDSIATLGWPVARTASLPRRSYVDDVLTAYETAVARPPVIDP